MSEENDMSESNGVAIARMEGKIDLVLAAQARQGEDIKQVRDVQEAQRETLANLTGLNIQERLVSQSEAINNLREEVQDIKLVQASAQGERKGVEISAKVFYGMLAVGGIGMIAAIARIITGVI